jgi:proline dehydrogenase
MINKSIAAILPYMPKKLIWQFSKKYIAGERLEPAIEKATDLRKKGMLLTLDILGEEFTTEEMAVAHSNEYIHAIETAGYRGIDTTFSLKPTMFGLKYNIEFCFDLISKIVVKARENDYMIRLDMEDSTCTDETINLFHRLYSNYPDHIGLVLQAYLYRTYKDIITLSKLNSKERKVNIRLCKGIYIESQDIAIKNKQNIRENFIKLVELLIRHGFYPAIATHDKYLIDKSLELINQSDLTRENYEFQMLFGVRRDLRDALLREHQPLRIYLPFGKEWFKYSTRRLRENPFLVGHIIKSILYGR